MNNTHRHCELASIGGLVRASRHTADRLPAELRGSLERAFATDLDAVRVHVGRVADRACRALGADAFASGADVVFRDGAYAPHTIAGRWLIAHEVAHLVQQARRRCQPERWVLSNPGGAGELEADAWADRAMLGLGAPARAARVTVTDRPRHVIQRHVSFEHRLLGDGKTADLVAVSTNGASRGEILARQVQLLDLWQNDPQSVTEAQIKKLCPWIRTVRLGGPDGLIVTYGELNALPDYLANHEAMDKLGPDVVLPILQVIRQEGFNQLTVLSGQPNPNKTFAGAASSPWKLSLINNIVETSDLDEFTFGLGPRGQDHYQGLLARNACHFAPFSWYRWQATHLIARDLAARAHQQGSAELARQAWVAHGYADHFLQDSFAAGHLVNKTLVMQWFVEWAATQKLLPIADWEAIKDMTTAKQPNLGGLELYDPSYSGASMDPQTAQEAATLIERITASAVTGTSVDEQLQSYRQYLTFLTSAATQLSSANLHDYYNAHSLWVSSEAVATPFEVWGDDTLFTGKNGGPGVQHTSDAAQMSQQALTEILSGGGTSISVEEIRKHFPTKAGPSSSGLQPLKTWALSQKQQCIDHTFPGFIPQLKTLVIALGSPRLGIVSQDQIVASIWARGLPKSSYGQVTLVAGQGRLFAGSNGSVHELDPASGKVQWSLQVSSSVGVGDYRTQLLFDDGALYVGVHGFVYKVDTTTHKAVWNRGVGGTGYHPVSLAGGSSGLFAGCNGYVYQLDPSHGSVVHQLLVTSGIGTGDYHTRIDCDADAVYVATHGYVYGVKRSDWSKSAWYVGVGNTGYHVPSVLAAGQRLFAGCNGYAYEIDRQTGKVLHGLLVTSSVGVGNYETRLSYDHDALFVGVHGYLYRIDTHGDWSATTWSRAVEGVTYNPVSVIASDGRLFAGSNGYVYDVDAGSGGIRQSLLLTYILGAGDFDTQLELDGQNLFAGVHGFAYDVSVDAAPILGGHFALPSLPSARQLPAAAASDTAAYLAGGGTMGPDIGGVKHTLVRMTRDSALGGQPAWEVLPDLPTARWGPVGVFANGKLWVIGGFAEQTFTNAVESYDPASNAWARAAAMPTARDRPTAVVAEGKIHVFGGYQRLGQGAGPYTTHEAFDLGTGAWTKEPSMLATCGGGGAAFIDGKTYVVAAEGTDQIYDHGTKTWTRLGAQWPGRSGRSSQYAGGSVVALGTKIYVFGGWGVLQPYTAQVWCLDTVSERWSTVGGANLIAAQGGAGTATIPLPGGGTLIVAAGGAKGQVNVQPTAGGEAYLFE